MAQLLPVEFLAIQTPKAAASLATARITTEAVTIDDHYPGVSAIVGGVVIEHTDGRARPWITTVLCDDASYGCGAYGSGNYGE